MKRNGAWGGIPYVRGCSELTNVRNLLIVTMVTHVTSPCKVIDAVI